MSKIFVTSDTHYDHLNIIRGTSKWDNTQRCRSFATAEQHNFELLAGINRKVGEDDILYHLGDFSFGGIDNIWNFRKQINCKNIHFILGNHDHHIERNKILPNCHYGYTGKLPKDGEPPYNISIESEQVKAQELFSSVQYYKEIKIDGHMIVLFHYRIDIWNKRHKGWYHLHGHSHGTAPTRNDRSMDVGVDTHPSFEPYHVMDEVIPLLRERENKPVDHHNINTN